MAGAVTMRAEHLVASHDARGAATLDELAPLSYARAPDGLPQHVRAASALRRFGSRLVIVQDDVNALAVVDEHAATRAVPLPPHPSGRSVFDDALGNKHEKLDLEAVMQLADGRLVAFGSGSAAPREQLVVWNGKEMPVIVAAGPFYRRLRDVLRQGESRLNIEGAVLNGSVLQLFHRGNDARGAAAAPRNAVIDVDAPAFVRWLDREASEPSVMKVTTVDLGVCNGVPFGFTDAVEVGDGRVVVLACAEDSASALEDGAVLGCRVGLLEGNNLRTVDVCDAAGRRTLLKLEGIEQRPRSRTEFDVVVDVDRGGVPAQLGRLVWDWR